ncbi:MAG: hypothetical protein Q9227_008688 [Pyrenula ochraceoflavens]
MLRELLSDHQSKDQEKSNPGSDSAGGKKEDEEFVDINHEDVQQEHAASKETSHDDDANWEDDEDEGEFSPISAFFGAGQRQARKRTPSKRDEVHPFTAVLSLSNLESCVALENVSFPENERCSKEKFIYRLSKCPELSFGILSRTPLSQRKKDDSADQAQLVAHIIATRTSKTFVTDASMALPPDWETTKKTLPSDNNEDFLGHEDQGGTIAIHSLAVLPEHRGKGLGATLLKSYTDRIKDARIADRVALITHKQLIPFYEKLGFLNKGQSDVKHGGGNWYNMTLREGTSREFQDQQGSKMKTSWKEIQPVPTSQEFIDIVLSRTQRRLPTQIRSGFKISRIRNFYTRKVKFTQETFCEKFQSILDGFPKLSDLHPFHKDLLHTLYEADHFKIALGQVSTAKRLIETVSRDYVRLLKYAQSLFQCKQLKKAALGRMATICKRLKEPLIYLEQVRMHLGRLPSIDPTTRTLLICGYPNVGKSSFLRSITRADVDVQPYAFTTKSLFVGHFDYKYLRFQAIDTPGILDHPLDEMNTIEMQSITAIAHLRSAILYFMDLSEHCGYSVEAQLQLFRSIKPLFKNKLVFIVINKIDITKPEDLDTDIQEQLQALCKDSNVEMLQLSCMTTEGVTHVKNSACDKLIAERVSEKLKAGTKESSGMPTGRLGDLLGRIHVAQPLEGVTREVFIPEAVKNLKKYNKDDSNRKKLQRDIEEENGGAGVYNVDLKASYDLENPEWKHDKIPEVFNGKNVYDFIDPDIEEKLAALEAEEEKLEAEGYYDSDESIEDAADADLRMKAELIREKRALMRNDAKMRKSLKNRAVVPRKFQTRTARGMEQHLENIGLDSAAAAARARGQSRGRPVRATSLNDLLNNDPDAMDIDPTSNLSAAKAHIRAKSQNRAPTTNRLTDGLTATSKTAVTDPAKMKDKAAKMAKLSQRKMNRMARQGEADRHTTGALVKHLVTGKRGVGKTNRR